MIQPSVLAQSFSVYRHDLFTIPDPARPADWQTEASADGEHDAYPPALNAPGVFEKFFADRPTVVPTFWHAINHAMSAA